MKVKNHNKFCIFKLWELLKKDIMTTDLRRLKKDRKYKSKNVESKKY